MTEAEWPTCQDPEPMLQFLMRNHKASDRKLRLFAVACARRAMELLPTDRELGVLDAALLLADRRLPDQDLRLNRGRIGGASIAVLLGPAVNAANDITNFVAMARGRGLTTAAYRAERTAQANLLREVFGNPARPVTIEPDWLVWNQHFVHDMARGIYDDRTFHRLPILADALEDAGCMSVELLEHLRGPGPHVRGCFAVDALLGKS